MMKNYCLFLLILLGLGSNTYAQYPGCPGVVMDPSGVGITVNGDGTLTACEQGTEITLTANYLKTGGTETYSVSEIPYDPPFPFNTGTATSVAGDDEWSEVIELGFDFCFFNQVYDKALATDNGAITFSIAGFGGMSPPFGYAAWSFNQPIPFAAGGTSAPYNTSIFGVFQDTNASQAGTNPPSPPGSQITYEIVGEYPCRTLVFNIYNIGQFSCNQNVGLQTSQVVLYEGTNIIDVFVENRTPCTTHNGGNGLIGVQNQDGTIGITPPERNTGAWSAQEEAWRFTPDGPPNYTLEWFQDGVLIDANQDVISIIATETTDVTARVTYVQCGGDTIVSEQNLRILYEDPPILGEPRNLTQCVDEEGEATFDLTTVNNDITINPAYFFTFYESEQDMEDGVAMDEIFVTDQTQIEKTIWVVAEHEITHCFYVKSFTVRADDCNLFLEYL